jgi:SAM-dependent methyltransferase
MTAINSLSQHYTGEAGKAYFAFQNEGGDHRGRINARKFRPYIKPTDTVLDFGCGNGSLLRSLQCAQRIGVEINPAARAVASQAGVTCHENPATVADATVDVVISNHALEHVPSPLQSLIDLRRTLRPGGRVILCVPIDDWRQQRSFWAPDIHNHLYTWSPKLFGNLLCEAGYEVHAITVYTHAWPEKHWQILDRILPTCAFDLICRFTAWRLKRRQIIAVAKA